MGETFNPIYWGDNLKVLELYTKKLKVLVIMQVEQDIKDFIYFWWASK